MCRYTPTSLNSTTGYFDLVVKAYPPGAGAGVSSYITSLKPGDNIEVKGCYTKKKIVANQYKEIGLIAGGSGLTPMMQVAQELLNTVEDETKLSLLFANVSPDDVYLKDELDELASLFPERFSVTYAHTRIRGLCCRPPTTTPDAKTLAGLPAALELYCLHGRHDATKSVCLKFLVAR